MSGLRVRVYCLPSSSPLGAVSAGEGEEAVLLPAVGHDLLGPDLPLSAVGAEVDAVLVMVISIILLYT